MSHFPGCNDSPIPLPLGMKLSQLITRKKSLFAADSFSDSRNESVENCRNNNIISRMIEKYEGPPKKEPSDDCRVSRENGILVSKSDSIMGNGAKKKEFFKNYGLNITENLKQRSLDTYKHLCGSNNTRRITKKSLVYQDLYMRQKIKQKEHRDIENFQRLYIDNLYRSPATTRHSGTNHNDGESPNFFPSSQYPSMKTSYNNDGTLAMQADESEQKMRNPIDENCDSSFFTPQTFAENSAMFHTNWIPPKRQHNNEGYLRYGKEVPSTEDLFRNECGLRNKCSNSWKQQNAGYNGQYSSYSSANIYENEPIGASTAFYSNANSPYFANSPAMNGENAEPDKNLICCKYSNSSDDDSITGEFSYSPDMGDYSNEKYSNSPEKIFMDDDNYSNSPAIYSQNSNENVNLNDTSQYSFYNQNSSQRTPPPEPKYLKEKNLTPLICYPEKDGTVIIEKLRM